MPWNESTSRQFTPELEIFVLMPNDQGFLSVVLDASTVTPDVDGVRKLVAGTPLAKNANEQYEKFTDDTTQDCLGILAHAVTFTSATDDQPAGMAFHSEVFRADRIVGWATPAIATAIKAALPTCQFK
jgi:hypothetical protein